MNQIDLPLLRARQEPPAPRGVDSAGGDRIPEIDLMRLWAMVRRQWYVPVLGALVGIALAIAYLATTPPTYTAIARVLVEDRLSKLVEDVSPAPAQLRTDATILSEMEILRSTRLAETVVRELELWKNPEFMRPPTSLTARLIGGTIGTVRSTLADLTTPDVPTTSGREPTEAEREAARIELAVLRLQGGLLVQRAGRSFAILIGFRSHSPVLARDIANAYTRIYLADELNASLAASRRAATWMQARLDELQRDSQEAALAVERFRAEKGLTSARGQLVSEQELSELSSQLVLARAEAARAEARFRQYSQVAERSVADAVGEAVLRDDGEPVNPTLVALREDYRSVDRRLRDVVQIYDENHPQAIALADEREKLERSISREIERTVRALENVYETAKARENAIAASVGQATGRSTEDSEAQVSLRELEQQSDALSGLYTTFLARFEQVSKQQSFPLSRVRVLSEAGLPRGKSAPRSTLALAMFAVLGGMAGAAIGVLRELRDRFLRTEEDVRRSLNTPFMGYVPSIAVSVLSPATRKAEPQAKAAHQTKAELQAKTARPVDATPGDVETIAARQGPVPARELGRHPSPSGEADEANRRLAGLALFATPPTKGGPSEHDVTRARMLASAASPSSMLAETLRDVRIAADVVLEDRPFKVLGIISALPGEGKTTLAANLAAHIAAAGSPVLLIDGDMRKPSATRTLAPGATTGLIDALTSDGRWNDVAGRVDPDLPLAFVPNVMTRRLTHSRELLSSRAMRSFVKDAGETFPYIVLDLPPIVPVADARAVAPLVDAFVLVAAWGETPRALLRSQLASAPMIRERLLGTVLNRVDLDRLRRYEGDEGRSQFIDRFGGYYAQSSNGVVRV